MISRCTNPASRAFADYGGRGIKVSGRWLSFDAFLADMGPRPGAGYSLDRIDPNGHYEPGNVRWATRYEQAQNKRLSRQRVVEVLDGLKATHTEPAAQAALDRVRALLLG